MKLIKKVLLFHHCQLTKLCKFARICSKLTLDLVMTDFLHQNDYCMEKLSSSRKESDKLKLDDFPTFVGNHFDVNTYIKNIGN